MPSPASTTSPPVIDTLESDPPASEVSSSVISDAPSSASSATPNANKTTTRITAAAKKRLYSYFDANNWPLNTNLPQGNNYISGDLGRIAAEFNLKRSQVVTQLRNYKDEKYGNKSVQLILNADQLEEKMRMGLSMESAEFMSNTLARVICDKENDTTSSVDFINFSKLINDFPANARTLVRLLADSPDHELCVLLSGLVDDWITIVAEKFPKTAAALPNAEVEFQKRKTEKKNAFVVRWMEYYTVVGVEEDITRHLFGRLGQYLHNGLYLEFMNSAIDSELPPISFPEESLVGKYATRVVYYVAGWTLYCATKALQIAACEKPMYFSFAEAHKLTKEDAETQKLPISLVERRKRRSAKVYCSKDYFDFICFVESVYLANLTLRMMRAYSNGDIVDKIKTSLLSNDLAIEKFTALCDNEHCGSLRQNDVLQIMKYMMEKYANMRGTYFVRHLKGNNNGNLVNKLAESQATRTKVANAVVCAKAVAESKDEQQLWKDAGESVLAYADEVDTEISNSC